MNAVSAQIYLSSSCGIVLEYGTQVICFYMYDVKKIVGIIMNR